MIGEMRDFENCEIAVKAALTGHFVMSTLHTNDAASAITRLLDLGVPAYLLTATVIGVLAQRLVRTLCRHCKVPDDELKPDALAKALPGWSEAEVIGARFEPYKPVGCLDCRMTGYRGRSGLFELLTMDEAVRGAIAEPMDLARVRQQALGQGLTPLRLAGLRKVAQGLTTLDEVLRATPDYRR
jgi:general secretion pathway protein E